MSAGAAVGAAEPARVSLGVGVGPDTGPDTRSDRRTGTRCWEDLGELEIGLRVQIRLAGLTLRQVRALGAGDVLISHRAASEEVPLGAAGVELGWCEFEVVDGRLAVRLTRLG